MSIDTNGDAASAGIVPTRIAAITAIALVGLLTACGGDAAKVSGQEGGRPSGPSLEIVSGKAVSDSIDAVTSIVVEVRDSSGALAPHRRVEFTSSNAQLSLVSDPRTFASSFSIDSTDVAGRAMVFVKLTSTIGVASVAASVPSLQLSDTASYATQPGAAESINLSPDDTALYAQNSFQVRATTRDRRGNARADTVTYSAGPLTVSVTSGGRVTAGDIGRLYVVGRVGSLVDTTWVSIVPHGTVAGFLSCGNVDGLAVMNLDGSGSRFVVPNVTASYPISPSWSPDGKQITYTNGKRTHVTDLSGNDRRITTLSVPSVEMVPRYSVDGQWIWYSAGDEWPAVDLWRIRADGSGAAERIGPGSQPAPGYGYNLFWQAIAFPDNRRVAFLDGGYYLHILDLVTKQIVDLNSAHSPRYSSTRDLIVYQAGTINVMKPDGTGQRQISPQGRTYNEVTTVDWSPDGQWIIASGAGSELINYSTGLVLPLRFSCAPSLLAWQPGS